MPWADLLCHVQANRAMGRLDHAMCWLIMPRAGQLRLGQTRSCHVQGRGCTPCHMQQTVLEHTMATQTMLMLEG